MCWVGGCRSVALLSGRRRAEAEAGQGHRDTGGDGGGAAVADTVDLGGVWTAATDELADEIVSAQQRAYLRLTRLRAIVEDTALLSVPDAFTRDVIESRLRPAITDALSRRLGRPIQVAVTVRAPEDGSGRPGTVYGAPPPEGYANSPTAEQQAPPSQYSPPDRSQYGPDPRYAPPAYGHQTGPPGYPEQQEAYGPTGSAQHSTPPQSYPRARDGQDALFAAPLPQTPMPQTPMHQQPATLAPSQPAPQQQGPEHK
jgi:chromosomal replication initiator protein